MSNHVSPYAMSSRGTTAIRTPRDVEYDAFSRITAALKRAQSSQDTAARVAAVHQNSGLWNTLLADLTSSGNALPPGLRGDLISLALFSVRHGLKVMSDTADIAALIDINLSVMRGLRGEAAA